MRMLLVAVLVCAARAGEIEAPRLVELPQAGPTTPLATPGTLDAAASAALAPPPSSIPEASALAAPASIIARPAAMAATTGETQKPQYKIPPTVASRLAAPKDHPAIAKYIEMMEKMAVSWGSPYSNGAVNRAQADAAAAAGVDLALPQNPNGVIVVPPGRRSPINRWADMFAKTMNGLVLWSPVSNHNQGHGASWDAHNGWLWADDFSPLMTRPSAELQHEFLHAYVDRGVHAEKFVPMTTAFRKVGWEGFPAAEAHPDAAYKGHRDFRADEVLTNLHTLYFFARQTVELHQSGETLRDPAATAREVQRVVKWIETPLFLAESVAEMAKKLLPVAYAVAREGTKGDFQKSYHRQDGSIPYVGEVESNKAEDRGWYEAKVAKEKRGPGFVRYFSKGQFKDERGVPVAGNYFPVLIGRDGYSAVVELNREFMFKNDLDDPKFQQLSARAAASYLVPRLAALARAIKHIEPELARIKELQERARLGSVDLILVGQIRDAARAAFLKLAHFFIDRRPAR